MKRVRRWRDLQWRLECVGFDLVGALLRLLPVDAASAIGGVALGALGPMTPTHRTVLRNLRLAFPAWDEAERRRVAQIGRAHV